MIWKVSRRSLRCPDNLEMCPDNLERENLCTKSCKTTFYAHLSRIWKLTRFTRFIRKVFATKSCCPENFRFFWLWSGHAFQKLLLLWPQYHPVPSKIFMWTIDELMLRKRKGTNHNDSGLRRSVVVAILGRSGRDLRRFLKDGDHDGIRAFRVEDWVQPSF